MNQEPVSAKEFIAIMAAGLMIMIPLLCNPQYVAKHPVYLGQAAGIQMGSERDGRSDYTHDSMYPADSFRTERVAPPFSDSHGSGYGTWTCYIGNSFTAATGWVSSIFGGMGRYLMQEKAY